MHMSWGMKLIVMGSRDSRDELCRRTVLGWLLLAIVVLVRHLPYLFALHLRYKKKVLAAPWSCLGSKLCILSRSPQAILLRSFTKLFWGKLLLSICLTRVQLPMLPTCCSTNCSLDNESWPVVVYFVPNFSWFHFDFSYLTFNLIFLIGKNFGWCNPTDAGVMKSLPWSVTHNPYSMMAAELLLYRVPWPSSEIRRLPLSR